MRSTPVPAVAAVAIAAVLVVGWIVAGLVADQPTEVKLELAGTAVGVALIHEFGLHLQALQGARRDGSVAEIHGYG
jgi:hypothetical protein